MKKSTAPTVYIDGHREQKSYGSKGVIDLLRKYEGYFLITNGIRALGGIPCACPAFKATAYRRREDAQKCLDDLLREIKDPKYKDCPEFTNYYLDYSVKEIGLALFNEYRRNYHRLNIK